MGIVADGSSPLTKADAQGRPVVVGRQTCWRGETSEEIDARRAKRKRERQARKKNRRRG